MSHDYARGPASGELTNPEKVIRRALDQCIDAIVGTAFLSGDRAGWLTWEIAADGNPRRMIGGNASLYDGDAGVAWALVHLSKVLRRSDLLELALRTAEAVTRGSSNLRSGGLLDGRTGVYLFLKSLAAETPHVGEMMIALPPPNLITATDMTTGLAGRLLAEARTNACGPPTLDAVDLLHKRARIDPLGVCWPDPLEYDPVAGRPLCGMSHGNSGIALALAEAAAAYPRCAVRASSLAAKALQWESAWLDPMEGGWPDLRGETTTYPVLWCHGAAGIGAARLRLLQLCDDGLDLGIEVDTLRAEAELAVQACGHALYLTLQALGRGKDVPTGGLTLCHGLGGPLDVLVLASETWGVPAHLAAAKYFAAEIVSALGDDPLAWPAGVRAPGSVGLFVGVSGVAMVLARLLHAGDLPSPSLLL